MSKPPVLSFDDLPRPPSLDGDDEHPLGGRVRLNPLTLQWEICQKGDAYVSLPKEVEK